MGWDSVSELLPPTGLLFIHRVMCEHWEPWWWWWGRLGITPDSSTRAPWQSYPQTHLGQVEGMYDGVRILPISIWNTSKESLTCRKILRHGTSGFTSHPKKGVLRIFIGLKNPSPRQGVNPRPLGPVALHHRGDIIGGTLNIFKIHTVVRPLKSLRTPVLT
jgi:hypothetical protein